MKYHNITKDDMLNGDGLRIVLWVSGCAHHCRGCQNPITWDPEDGLDFDEAAKNEIITELRKDYIAGFTFSGGDPLHPKNISEVEAFARLIKEQFPNKTIWLYTGDIWENIKELSIISYLDVIVDGPFIEEKKDNQLCWKGSLGQRVIDVKSSLKEGKVVLHCDDYYDAPQVSTRACCS